jgi:hypothetical protein
MKTADPKDWKLMSGSNDIVKKINSYLSTEIIGGNELPCDECLHEAEHIYNTKMAQSDISKYLECQFGYEGCNLNFNKEAFEVCGILYNTDHYSCMICQKSIKKVLPDQADSNLLLDACLVQIQGNYGSIFDCTDFKAIICDVCVENIFLKRGFYEIKDEQHSNPMSDREVEDWVEEIKKRREIQPTENK